MDYKKKIWFDTIDFIDLKYDKTILKKINKNSNKCAVIIEPRILSYLSGILKNIVSKLNNDWSLIIFHGNKNKEFIKNIIGDCNIRFINLELDNISKYQYSDLLLKKTFWNLIPSEYILIFQHDTLLLKQGIEYFLKYDYIGAPWKKINPCIEITNCRIGNGGLSLRRKSKTLKVLELIEPDFKSSHLISEDIFYSKWFKKLNYYLPSVKEASLFSSEHIFNKDCYGVHKIYDYLTLKEIKQLLNFEFF